MTREEIEALEDEAADLQYKDSVWTQEDLDRLAEIERELAKAYGEEI